MDENLGTMLAQVSRLMRRSFDEAARSIGVTRPQWQVLSVLGSSPGIHQGGLADILEVEPITAARMIDRLQEAGLVERRADPADRRAWRLFLTARGEELGGQLQPCAANTLDSAFDGIDTADQERLRAMLGRIRANLSRKVQAVASEAVSPARETG